MTIEEQWQALEAEAVGGERSRLHVRDAVVAGVDDVRRQYHEREHRVDDQHPGERGPSPGRSWTGSCTQRAVIIH